MGAYFNYTVPDGLVAVIRGFRYNLYPVFFGVSLSDITGSLTVGGPAYDDGTNIFSGGAEVKGYTNFQLGQGQSDFVPTYIVVGSNTTISLILRFSANYNLLFVPTNFNAEFYGNLLVSTGRPVNYEPGFSEPLPVYDKTDYQRKKENELISSQSTSAGKVMPKKGIAASPPVRELPAILQAPAPSPVPAPKPIAKRFYRPFAPLLKRGK